MTKEKQSDALDALDRMRCNATYGIKSYDHEIISMVNYDKEIMAHFKDVETIRTALTEHAAIKEVNFDIDDVFICEDDKGDMSVKIGVESRYDANMVYEQLKHITDPICLSNPPQSDNQAVLTGEDDSQMDALKRMNEGLNGTIESQAQTFTALAKKAKALEAENARLRSAMLGLFKALYAYGSQGSEYNKAIQVAEQALKGQDNDAE